MKKIVYILGASLLLTTACKDSFLDQQPISQISSKNFYKSAQDLQNAVNGAYAALQLQGQYTEGLWVTGELRSDNTDDRTGAIPGFFGGFDLFLADGREARAQTIWNDHYQGINRCNQALNRMEGISMEQTLKDRYAGELKFLRALMYFNLVRLFGDVPMPLKEVKNVAEGYNQGRINKDEVYAQIIKDLQEAEPVLPLASGYATAEKGRATAGAAQTLLAKVYLTLRKYPEALEKLDEVVNSKQYSLMPNYADLFVPFSANHSESIFEVQFKEGA